MDIAGSTPHPTAAFMRQGARQLTDPFEGFLLGTRSLVHERDTTFTAACDQDIRDHGVEPGILPPQSPNLHVHGERFVCSIKEEALERRIFMGEALLRYAIRWYLRHDHAERTHQGLDHQLIAPGPEVGRTTGPVKRRARLGGLLSSYDREAA